METCRIWTLVEERGHVSAPLLAAPDLRPLAKYGTQHHRHDPERPKRHEPEPPLSHDPGAESSHGPGRELRFSGLRAGFGLLLLGIIAISLARVRGMTICAVTGR